MTEMVDYPSVLYPTIVSGKIWGEKIRCESLDGSELIKDIPGGSIEFQNAGPHEENGKLWGITHLQKYSPKGWLKVDPDCFHWWYFWRLQQQDANGNWIPGTEKGIYFRKSRVLFQTSCWRWDVAGTMIDGVLRHWIRSGGYLGGHWD